MANSTRTQKSSTSRGRFGRGAPAGSPGAGRSLRARSGEAGPKGRFGLGSSLGPSGYGRPGTRSAKGPSTAAKWTSRSKSKSKQESGVGKALSALSGMSGGKAAKKATTSSAKPAGLALLAGAAGLALKNRDKLMGKAGRGREGAGEDVVTPGSAYGGTTPGVQEDNRSAPSPGGTTDATMASPPETLTDPQPNGRQADESSS